MDRRTGAIVLFGIVCVLAGYFARRSNDDFRAFSSNAAEWALVIVGIITFVVMGWQSWETRKSANEMHRQAVQVREQTTIFRESAEAAKSAADAANLNAKTLINIERAWIEVYLKLGPNPSIVEHSSSGAPDTTTVSLGFTCTNHGKTPAWITMKQIGMMILHEHIAVPDELPGETEFPLIGPELVAAGTDMPHTGHLNCEGRITKGHPALVYGKVSYLDIFRERRTTTFGFWISEARKLDRLPFVYPAYNEHT
jgi:hypothetical protein